jgi:hypothetical protein
MDINKKLTELIDGVNNGDIDTLADLQRELIYLRSEIQALRIHDVVGRSEQLKCEHKGRRTATELVEYCEDCKKILFHP